MDFAKSRSKMLSKLMSIRLLCNKSPLCLISDLNLVLPVVACVCSVLYFPLTILVFFTINSSCIYNPLVNVNQTFIAEKLAFESIKNY